MLTFYFLDEAGDVGWGKTDTRTTELRDAFSTLGSAAQYAAEAVAEFTEADVDEQKRERSKWPTRFVSGARGAKSRAWRKR